MKAHVLAETRDHKWIVLGRDPAKPDYVIDTNEYIIIAGDTAMVLDPGGTEIFPEVVTAVTQHTPIESIKVIFGSHQDPDIISSLSLWLGLCPEARVYVPWTWSSFITHFGCDLTQIISVPDEGQTLPLTTRSSFEIIPAHYLHSSGNIHLYDAKTGVYFSGDIGAALLPDDYTSMFVEDFDTHIRYMEGFHRRWMPSNRARDVWLERIRPLKIEMLCPQHGAIFRGKQVRQFLDWFASLELGSACTIVEKEKAA